MRCEAGGSELSALMHPSVMPGLVPGIHALQCSSKKDVDGRVKPGHDELTKRLHRPTMTPITFGADRYFSSMAARAAARFSGVSRPRFSAKIIQQ